MGLLMREKRKCLHCVHADFCRQHSRIRLVERDTLTQCMWINPHIKTAYRPLNLPWHLCVKSIFQWNNETINVWSHLIGFIYIGYMQYHIHCELLPRLRAPIEDYVAMGISMLCSQICMLLSTSYHTFGCRSASGRQKWLKADQFGISIGLMGLYLSGIYTSFYHFPDTQRIYIITLTVLLAASAYLPFRFNNNNNNNNTEESIICQKSTKQYKEKLRSFQRRKPVAAEKVQTTTASEDHNSRIGLIHFVYIGLTLFGIYPTWHWIELHGGISHPHVQQWLPSLIILFGLCGLAFVFYATLIPERFSPGKFDFVGCSHQWWHLLILAAMIFWHGSGIKLLTHYHTNKHTFAQTFQENSTAEIRFGGNSSESQFSVFNKTL